MKKFFKYYLLFLSLFFISCYDEITDNPAANLPPETGIFLYPDSTVSSQPSRLNVSWWGDDTDGIVIGYYFTWDGINWHFTASNDSLFALQIGAADTTYIFKVSAVDDGGNGRYDNEIIQNGINFGAEPFNDADNNGLYDAGEIYVDIGLIDPSPAEITFPIRNSSPELFWNELSTLPDTSYPVMSFGWEASDLDGDETIQTINIALNDTTGPGMISLDGGVRRITIRPSNSLSNPLMEILIDGNPNNLAAAKLSGISYNSNNIIYVQAVDISGAKSPFISLPAGDDTWYVKSPTGRLLIVDDYQSADNANAFYNSVLDSLGFTGNFDIYDIRNQPPPYISVTFLETIKLYNYIFWYTDNNPSLDLAAGSIPKFIDAGGKVFFSMQFPQSIDLGLVQSFLPISADSSEFKTSLLGGVKLSSVNSDYPDLETSLGIFRVRSFYPSQLGSDPVYYFPNNDMKGFIGLRDNQKKIFFMALPLHRLNAGAANVKNLFNKVLVQDFGLTP